LACPALAKANQVNTPIGRSLAVPEKVTIVDPRHPLYHQTFPLLHIKNQRQLIPSCLVRLPEGVERLVPVAATNLATSPLNVHPSPLDVSSLQKLVHAFMYIQALVETECGDGNATGTQSNADGNQTQSGLANTGGDTTADGSSDRSTHLPQPCIAPEAGGVK
jgi:hypothetical protein